MTKSEKLVFNALLEIYSENLTRGVSPVHVGIKLGVPYNNVNVYIPILARLVEMGVVNEWNNLYTPLLLIYAKID